MDMFKKDLVVAVKVNGQIMREKGDEHNEIHLPFGCEYSLLFKNLRSERVAVRVEIDGQEVIKDGRIVVPGNTEVELERFVEQLDKGNKFKFIQKTSQIQQYRGDRIDDGIVRIEFQYELPPRQPREYITKSSGIYGQGLTRGCCLDSSPEYNEGITVKGSESNQKFLTTVMREMEDQKHVITFKLRGAIEEIQVEKPVTVKAKLECTTCGTKNKSSNIYCGTCGTHL